MRKINKKANILTGNVVFIILNLVFFSILIIFVFIQTSSTHILEEKTAKQIVLIIDTAKPGTEATEIKLDVSKVLENIEEEINEPIIINNENNLVVVKLSEKIYYEYGFFNEVNVIYEIKKVDKDNKEEDEKIGNYYLIMEIK